MSVPLEQVFQKVDQEVRASELRIQQGAVLELAATVDQAIAWVTELMAAYTEDRTGEAIAADGADVLEIFKRFVKGDPSLNAVRDNIRELVYYRNCLAAAREDALPAKPANMAVRTARHIYLYLRTRLLKDSERPDA